MTDYCLIIDTRHSLLAGRIFFHVGGSSLISLHATSPEDYALLQVVISDYFAVEGIVKLCQNSMKNVNKETEATGNLRTYH